MKLVVGIIRPERLEAVKGALGEAKVFRLTVSDVQGWESAPASDAPSLAPRLVRKVKLEIAVNETFVEPTVRALASAAALDGGHAGDGKVLVLPLDDCIRIRTGERGPEAI